MTAVREPRYRCVGGPLDGKTVTPHEAIHIDVTNGWVYEFNPRLAAILTGRRVLPELVDERLFPRSGR